MKNILVFKTSVHSSQQLRTVEPLLNKLLDSTERWNFDLEDCDRILRIEAINIQALSIIENLRTVGVLCSELE